MLTDDLGRSYFIDENGDTHWVDEIGQELGGEEIVTATVQRRIIYLGWLPSPGIVPPSGPAEGETTLAVSPLVTGTVDSLDTLLLPHEVW